MIFNFNETSRFYFYREPVDGKRLRDDAYLFPMHGILKKKLSQKTASNILTKLATTLN
ncbi:hypothetical protein C8N47_11053 [Mangrovibacterium marinum]|uniref:Uncharacterized protein n=1 Tax=Mangrovibacterium marinum TaxID=1639118 RepID=A0A2T5C0N6_9BACT|nr:hypothetical protein C8N47_11053 [Mangrovibacterium marinum]